MSAVTSTLDLHPNLTDADRAFLLFGSVVVSLQTPRGWEVGNADHLVTKLEKAVKYDPKNKQYATTLARVRAKKDEITRIKRAQYKSRAGSGDIVGSYFPKSKERGPGGDIFSDFQRRVWNILVDQVRKSPGNTFHADLLDSVGCPTCLGNGKGIYDGRTCPTCRGTGKCSAVKEK
jgi:DnaJ-class molecular chaperone